MLGKAIILLPLREASFLEETILKKHSVCNIHILYMPAIKQAQKG